MPYTISIRGSQPTGAHFGPKKTIFHAHCFTQCYIFSCLWKNLFFQEKTIQSKCFREYGGFKVCRFFENSFMIGILT